ncbi:MAG TPA: UDP-N-acetylmuramate dehydrogenase [Terriglobales bacterium]|nr:UDP-N-acetylmuramate dehydrogenase [Terriglobales bacterium]
MSLLHELRGLRVNVIEQESLARHTTLEVGGAARYWAEITRENEIPEALAWAEERHLPATVLGGGSNVLASDAGYAGLVLHMAPAGARETGPGRIEVAAGEDWDGFVAECVARGWAGVECLSGIPGSVGATPVQNVGAYGQEVAETMVGVRAWDRQARAWVTLTAGECRFAYRSSRFNRDDRGRFVIVAAEFQLRPGGAATLRYPELRRQFPTEAPGLSEVREVVRGLRRGKAMLLEPGMEDGRSAGSFFKNPVVEEAAAGALPAEAPRYPEADGRVKLPAAWLIEHAGLHKGFQLPGSRAALSRKHVLAIVNRGGATAGEIEALAAHIQAVVSERWGVRLAREPVQL